MCRWSAGKEDEANDRGEEGADNYFYTHIHTFRKSLDAAAGQFDVALRESPASL